ncbi:17.4 kDa class I heat shock family protein [Hibiscus syriacus]|uniref:17.4 kDa class I heat shock family protein n=1 Tax=Hibiscus syriacus TaxID=106335 RepID=A0A6A2ZD50_HIBSY|nr:17.4 kDa class I heat shock family protein [Hibiscus syriacus]
MPQGSCWYFLSFSGFVLQFAIPDRLSCFILCPSHPRPSLEFPEDVCQTAPNFQDVVIEDDGSHQQRKEELVLKEDGESGKFKSPSSGEFNVADDENDDGFKTPTSLDHKIPAIFKCPSAPRKPKSLPIISPKRKAFRRRILLDLTKEMESLFPPALLADLGNKIKKVRQGSDFK